MPGESPTFHLKAGLDSAPWLAGHAVQGAVILPGSYYVDRALADYRTRFSTAGMVVAKADFPQPFLVGNEDSVLEVSVEPPDANGIRYRFTPSGSGSPCAEVWILGPAGPDEDRAPLPGAQYAVRAAKLEREEFYARLAENGNEYGPAFQGLERISIANGDATGWLASPRHGLTTILDAAIQVLAGFRIAEGRTFVLQGIDRIEIDLGHPTGPGVVHAHREDRLEIQDGAGTTWLRLRGARSTQIANLRRAYGRSDGANTSIAIAATFTAEPIESVLQFWGDYLRFPCQVSFAPYNQVFQQLLDPGSTLFRNRSGYNLILLNVADWQGDTQEGAMPDGYRLPNGIRVAHLNRHETDYVYQEIFGDRCYLRHGVNLPAGGTVIDIGANIGLFSLFVRQSAPDAVVYAYEPNPVAFEALQANCRHHGGGRLHPFNLGVSRQGGQARLTYYENSSVFSSFHPDQAADRHAIAAVATNLVQRAVGATETPVAGYVDELLVGRLDERAFDCQLTSVADIIRDNRLERVDLLKIDAEKCELEILQGIADRDWCRIHQVVVEVHDRTGAALAEVQSILRARGFDCHTEEEKLLAGSGLYNVYATRSGATLSSTAEAGVARRSEAWAKAEEFVRALSAFSATATVPTIVCLCPAAIGSPRGVAQAEDYILEQIGALPQVIAIDSKEIAERYPSASFHDSHSNQLGHIPYGPDGFAAIGTSVIRAIAARGRAPRKVMALDCDNTLWGGVCGEDGPTGVIVTPAHRRLQEFVVAQQEKGALLCLCSKNNEADVREVFMRHPDMVLKWEHLAAHRVNWEPKSANLLDIARELNLSPDSFIFIDDNPVECAEVEALCPGTLAIAVPTDRDEAEVRRRLDHNWAFDRADSSAEDGKRTQLTRESAQRETLRQNAPTLAEFVESLELETTIFEPGRAQLDRVAQLTLRTNQFNATTRRRPLAELQQYLASPGSRALAIEGRDRFGEYGLVGALLYRSEPDSCQVDTLLLSCRALGRGMEHRFVAELGRRAAADGKITVAIPFRRSTKNQPAWEFLSSIGAEQQEQADGEVLFTIAAEKLAGLRYDPACRAAACGAPPMNDNGERRAASGGPAFDPSIFPEIAANLSTAAQIAARIESDRLKRAGVAVGGSPATLAGRILQIWRRVLGHPAIGTEENFFDAGGSSLKAVQVIAAIRSELGHSLPIVALFERPTVRALAESIEGGERIEANDAKARGARRKYGRKSAVPNPQSAIK